jgi:hypothetical protein
MNNSSFSNFLPLKIYEAIHFQLTPYYKKYSIIRVF